MDVGDVDVAVDVDDNDHDDDDEVAADSDDDYHAGGDVADADNYAYYTDDDAFDGDCHGNGHNY